jgi:hypothetical protein
VVKSRENFVQHVHFKYKRKPLRKPGRQGDLVQLVQGASLRNPKNELNIPDFLSIMWKILHVELFSRKKALDLGRRTVYGIETVLRGVRGTLAKRFRYSVGNEV